jgi:MFS family permease
MINIVCQLILDSLLGIVLHFCGRINRCGCIYIHRTPDKHEITASGWASYTFLVDITALSDILPSSGVVFTIGVGTLADIYEPAERGSKTGLFYAAPVLAQALAPTLGGILTQVFNWRSIFWFMAIFGGLNFISFLLFLKDTFRRERSSTYQAALEKRRHARDQKSSQPNVVDDAPTCPRSDNNAMMSCSVPSEELILSLADVNPFPTLMLVLQRMNNLAVIFTTGIFDVASNKKVLN